MTKRTVQIAAGFGVSAVALWLTLRGKDMGAMWVAIRGADYRYLVPYIAILLVLHVLRAVRWGLLLRPVARVGFWRLNAISAVGFMALFLLPFRLGEFARPILVAERPRLRTSAALSSVVVERAADGLFMGVLLVLALLAVPDGVKGVAFLRAGASIVSGAFLAVLVFLVFAYWSRARAIRLASTILSPFSRRLAERVSGMLDAFIHGLRVLPGAGSVVLFFILTIAYWSLNAFGMRTLALGFGFELSALQTCAVLGLLVVGVMIPAGPGMIGTFQGAVVLGLSLFAPPHAVETSGVAYANVLWVVQLVQQTTLGLVFLTSPHISLERLLGAPGELGSGLEAEEAEYRAAGE